MPTVFSECFDCGYLNWMPLDNIVNTSYKKDIDIMYLLVEKGLPKEIAIKIIEMSKIYTKCSHCQEKLCINHLRRNDMGSPFCGNCSWFDIS